MCRTGPSSTTAALPGFPRLGGRVALSFVEPDLLLVYDSAKCELVKLERRNAHELSACELRAAVLEYGALNLGRPLRATENSSVATPVALLQLARGE